ncbi:MAG: CaiB/BaiF CoA-transferase family protein [Proteobacteria bacterium]|nr:CaiB/BaiF CoA-transferase family protein [Pseudomonadota bacterium]
MQANTGPLNGVRILDLTRILAGPTCTQLLGDLGADIIKIEKPVDGDDTRGWGPPYLKDKDGNDTRESAYYMASNRNKRSVTVDIGNPDGVKLIKSLAKTSDVMIHNFKVGGLEKHGLGYDDIHAEFPSLVYVHISGFGRTGPYAPRAGYDMLAQGMGGIMSLTGPADGDPCKVGVGISDVMCGMYATTALLAALHHAQKTGHGQLVDLALLDAQVAWLINEGVNYLTHGREPVRRGNAHSNIVPYDVFPTADGYVILAIGNDSQYRRFCAFAGIADAATDPRFLTNDLRVRNRDAITPIMRKATVAKTTQEWVDGLAPLGVPSAPVNTVPQAFEDPQIRHRGMAIEIDHPASADGKCRLIGNPIKLSETPVSYRRPPPMVGQHTDEVLKEILNLDPAALQKLRDAGAI